MRYASVSDIGGRSRNEDAIRCVRKNNICCFVIADGLGGHGSGDAAAALAAKTITDCFRAQAEISKDVVYAYLEAAQNAIAEKRASAPQYSRMGTTVALLLTDGRKALWAHCGDSRVYRIQKHLIQEITDDHSVAFAEFMSGEISYDDIRTSPDQNKLLRTLSDGSKFRPEISEPIRVDEDTKFMLCTDGFWEYVDEDFMEKTLKRCTSPRRWLDKMVERREKRAPSDSDNYSAIVIFM